MDKEIRYLKDPTGVNKSNLIKNEKHYLTKQIKNRIIVPVEGAFFSKSVVIRDLFHNKKLDRIKDFVCGGLSSHYTKESGEEVCFFIIIHSDLISDSVEIDYQCYGGDGKLKNQSTVELLENSFVTGDRIPLAKILDLPKGFDPAFHYHDLGDIDKFEYLLFCLERIRLAVANNKTEVLNYLVDFEKMLHLLLNKTLGVFEINYHLKTKEYLDSFKKELFDLGKLRNYPLTTEAEGTKIADNSLSNVIRDHKEAYLNLLSLNAYSKKLLELLVNSRETGLGNSTELNIEANVENFEAMPIGSVFTIIDYNLAAISKNPQIDYLYPDRLDRANGYVIRKITGKTNKQYSLYLYIGRNIPRVYVLKISLKDSGILTQFTSIADDKQTAFINEKITSHIEDYQNPHMDDKRDVKLSQVENLPIATLEDIICNLPVRKYITLRRLFSYMKRFKTGRKDTREIFEDFSERSTTKRLQTIFSPCGAWDDSIDESKIEICKQSFVPPVTNDNVGIYLHNESSNSISSNENSNISQEWYYDNNEIFMGFHPIYYNSDGTRDLTKPAPGNSVRDWKHSNFFLNAFFFESSRPETIENYINGSNGELRQEITFNFRIFKADNPSGDIFFRVEFYILGSLTSIPTKRLSSFDFSRCEDFSDYDPIDTSLNDPYYNYFSDEHFSISANRVNNYDVPSQIGKVQFNCNRLASIDFQRDEETGEVSNFDFEIASGRAHKVRMKIIEISSDDYSSEVITSNDIGEVGSIDFVMSSVMFYYLDDQTESRVYHQLDSILNVTPSFFSSNIRHEVCQTANHE